MTQPFRVLGGYSDGNVHYLSGLGPPGFSAPTLNAPVSSKYIDVTNQQEFLKKRDLSGPDAWDKVIDESFLAQFGSSKTFEAYEPIGANELVNQFTVGAITYVRRARGDVAGFEAIGFIKEVALVGQPVTVYYEGSMITTGLTPGPQFLSTTPGQCSGSVLSGVGQVVQRVGYAISDTELVFQYNLPIIL